MSAPSNQQGSRCLLFDLWQRRFRSPRDRHDALCIGLPSSARRVDAHQNWLRFRRGSGLNHSSARQDPAAKRPGISCTQADCNDVQEPSKGPASTVLAT